MACGGGAGIVIPLVIPSEAGNPLFSPRSKSSLAGFLPLEEDDCNSFR
jgi:hypothetical protein